MRATKYILDLPFICDQTYANGDRLMKLNLLPISYWHEFFDMIIFFKVVTGAVRVSPSVLPQVLVTRTNPVRPNVLNNFILNQSEKAQKFSV